MQVQINGEPKNIQMQTITLQPESGDRMYSFHCPNCGNASQQTKGKVSKIYPFYEPSDQVLVVDKCRSCKRKFNFQTHDGYNSQKIKVILHPFVHVEDGQPQPDVIINEFYCYSHYKTKILDYGRNALGKLFVYSYLKQKDMILPFFSPCLKPTCDIVYYFADLV